MTDAPISPAVRQAVRESASCCCEYCFSQEKYCPDPLSIEHIIPRARGGSNDESNLAFSCQGCNGRKHVAVSAIDPVTEKDVPLYHPRQDVWSDHFAWSRGFSEIIGKTPSGRATVERLQLNRESLVNLRIVLRSVGNHPPIIPRI
ncbi:MAG: HNH endonuclease [Planctomycetes bacterium]|nr:HNH endonuclease [Planctomycetota bacterium]MBL7038932.1 HNH endonuclease [Pirellulaceae bacterium]